MKQTKQSIISSKQLSIDTSSMSISSIHYHDLGNGPDFGSLGNRIRRSRIRSRIMDKLELKGCEDCVGTAQDLVTGF